MAEVHLIRRERFNAAHKLWVADWDATKNHEVFGKCANENWHGHNYELFVTVKGQPDPVTGMVMDLKHLKRIIIKEVIDDLDHKNLDMDVPWMKGRMSSAENIAIAIWERLEGPIAEHGATLHQVKLWETENNIIDYFGK
jgi:6-pyruvoyltetrahydropterin/6-carboxytetrahydropterin synthase